MAHPDRFGLGINWLQQLERADDDKRRAGVPARTGLPPMFGCDRCVYQGVENGDESEQESDAMQQTESDSEPPEEEPRS